MTRTRKPITNMSEYLPLPTVFTKGEFHFSQVMRFGDLALFSKVKSAPAHKSGSFELIVVQKRASWEVGGKTIPAREAYPSSEQWGTQGWTYRDLETAKQKFEARKLGLLAEKGRFNQEEKL